MDIFDKCQEINDLLRSGNEGLARDELIQLLSKMNQDGLSYTPLINCLVRAVGLFPYLDSDTSAWQERYIHEVFKVDVGYADPVTLHREQSRLLGSLLAGKSIAVSAPTSFGKSFVIDAFIAIKSPNIVVIIVPTIALADETRRRLQQKYGETYTIITTASQSLATKTILIFPQERAISYLATLARIDILIIDEFYKASASFDKERSPSLIRAIVSLSKIAQQRYFLAPNINELKDNPFTDGMEFLRLDFNTVFLNKVELYDEIGGNEQRKSEVLIELLAENSGKTLIYAGTYTNIAKLATLLLSQLPSGHSRLLKSFQSWLSINYEPNWALTKLVAKSVGIHNGRLHRSLSQIQIKLFEEEDGLCRLLSTSSIIEGVNTSAENVVLWSNKNGKAKINDFTYKNIIGRGGRMFRHFVGNVFIMEKPPTAAETQLELVMPNELLGAFEKETDHIQLTPEQIARVEEYRSDMNALIGTRNWEEFATNNIFQTSNSSLLLRIAQEMRRSGKSWNGLAFLNSDNPNQWDRMLYKLINLQPGVWGIDYSKYVAFVKVLSLNWHLTIPEMLERLDEYEIGIDLFFELERNTTFRLASLLSDVQTIRNKMMPNHLVDVSLAISRLSHAFLPAVVFELEEYGIPRMISKKIHAANILDFEDETLDIQGAISRLGEIGRDTLISTVGTLHEFERYIVNYFYSGIEVRKMTD